MTVKIIPNDIGNPPGKVADAELHFPDGPLAGLKLIGFSVWQRRGGASDYNVTFPARQYSVNGERRVFALLRSIVDHQATERMRDLVIQAYEEYQEQTAQALARREQEQEQPKPQAKVKPAARIAPPETTETLF